MTSKYERFIVELQAAVVAADVANETTEAARALDLIVASDQTGLPAIIANATAATYDMVDEYVRYIWDDGAKPEWLAKAGL